MAHAPALPELQCPAPVLRPGGQGIARVAVDDAAAQLVVTFLAPIALPQQAYLLNPLSYSLTGGQRLFPRIVSAEPLPPASPPAAATAVALQLDGEGDFSIYTLTVSGSDIDPFFGSARLRFRLDCDDTFDCRPPPPRPPPSPQIPVAIDYLSKDYASFRQALLEFIPTRLPAWTERSEADLGMMLLELFAATADSLSYLQDRVANEAFLTTASQRRSVAAHLALVGYPMDEGASAHTWLQFQVSDVHTLPDRPGFKVSTRPSGSGEPVLVFETRGAATLRPDHNAMALYDWENRDCCLPSSATSAALAGSHEDLAAGDYLLFEDEAGHRDVVRLTCRPEIVAAEPVASPAESPPVPDVVTRVSWSRATPLLHDYCVARTVVRANLVLATHGETILNEPLRGPLTEQQKVEVSARIAASQPGESVRRQRLRLAQRPLAHLDPATIRLAEPVAGRAAAAPAAAAAEFTSRVARSVSELEVRVDGVAWQEQPTLLESAPDTKVFRVEIDDDGGATAVFGDGTFGEELPGTATVTATYRVGGGAVGDIGADTLAVPHPDAPAPWLVSVGNPLPAVGGRDLETSDSARRVGPASSHEPLVAVSAADYQALAGQITDSGGRPVVQRANASFRWTGSWLTVTLAVDPAGGAAFTPELRDTLLATLGARRLAGYDLEITGAVYLPVDLRIEFCAVPGARPSDVREALLAALSSEPLPGGARGFFHPDHFTFGDNLYVSQLFAAVMAVPGVESAQITRLARLYAAHPDAETAANLAQGFLAAGRDEVVRLDNDRNFPQNGTLSVEAKVTGARR